MTMDNMVKTLESMGFGVAKTFAPRHGSFRFSIAKDGRTYTKIFKYPTGESDDVKDKLQRDFIELIVDEFYHPGFNRNSNKTTNSWTDPATNKTYSYNWGINTDYIDTDYIKEDLMVTKALSYIQKATFFAIKKVIFNPPATIVFWNDGDKTVVKANNEDFDPEKGLAMAISKRAFGNRGNYFNEIKKWTDKYEASTSKESKREPLKVASACSKCLGYIDVANSIDEAIKSNSNHVYLAYHRLVNALHDKKATKKDMIMAINDAMYHIGGITVFDPDDPVLMAYRALDCAMEKKNTLKAVLGSAMEEAIGWLGSVLDD